MREGINYNLFPRVSFSWVVVFLKLWFNRQLVKSLKDAYIGQFQSFGSIKKLWLGMHGKQLAQIKINKKTSSLQDIMLHEGLGEDYFRDLLHAFIIFLITKRYDQIPPYKFFINLTTFFFLFLFFGAEEINKLSYDLKIKLYSEFL